MQRDRLVEALKWTILTFASFHLVVLLVLSLVRGQYGLINLLSILSLNLIWPSLGRGFTMFSLGLVLGLAVYSFYYLGQHRG